MKDRFIIPPPFADRIKFDLQRFAESVTATASSDYTITLPDDDKTQLTVTISGGAISKVNDGTSEITATNGYYLINGYRVTLNYDSSKSELTSTAVKEESSTNITGSQTYTVKLTSDGTDSQSITVANNQTLEKTSTDSYLVTIGDTTVNATFNADNTLNTAVDSTGASLIDNGKVKIGSGDDAKTYTLKLNGDKVDVTEHNVTATGTLTSTQQVLTLGSGDNAITLYLSISDKAITGATYKVGTDGTEQTATVTNDGKSVKIGSVEVDLTIDESGKVSKAEYPDFTATAGSAEPT